MDKNTRIYLIVFLVLLAIAGGYFLKGKMANHVTDDKAFAEKDSNSIQRVVITDTKGAKISLVRDGKQWKANDSIIAMPTKINFLLRTLAGFKVIGEIEADRAPEIMAHQLKTVVTVELYDDAAGKPFKAYVIGDPIQSDLGNYAMMLIDGKLSGKPYVIGMTNKTADMQHRFFTGAEDWRDLKIFDYNIDDIKRATIIYPYHPASSFRLTVVNRDSATIEKMIAPTDTLPDEDKMALEIWTKKTPKLSKPRINDFLNSFKFINAEAYDNSYANKDSVTKRAPLAKIYLEIKDGVTDSIIVYLMPANQRTKADFDKNGNPAKYDTDRYFALINHNKDFVVIQQYVFGKIFRQRNDFYIFN